ncbi:hypothetical protein [Sphingomonas sp.]|jgi:hypothetical protein|uniref:hypothetical protein n=1 Tax=Sphingomonas sp. TaxID=28214 RepID=UPI00261B3D94|nr:hypothetical protein [Sphingomonas sp.]MDF2603479.1 hypothetical protein [Sphingomonas sp.]
MSLKPLSAAAGAALVRGHGVDAVNRETHDFYPTWPAATRALLGAEQFDGAIWEPACGDGAMSRVLEGAGYQVISTDLIDRGFGEGGRDFLGEWAPLAPNIVTNPPFRWAVEFVNRALMLTAPERPGNIARGKVALFLRLAFLEGQERGAWFPNTPLARVWVMSRRVPMDRGKLASNDRSGGGVIAFAWFVWEHGHEGAPALGWLDWKAA